jgi:hypothetical protein
VRGAVLLSAVLLLALARGARAGDPAPSTPSPPAARVVAAIAVAARENAAALPSSRLSGDALADHYVRRAAAAAGSDATAFLVGLAHAFDPDATLARFPLTRAAFAGLETPAAAAARRREMGDPALRARADLLLHFVVPAALCAVAGEGPARLAGVAKELGDMNGGGGFSFVDLYADEAGIAFSRWLEGADTAARLARVSRDFCGAELLPEPERFPEGITKEAFARDYGNVQDPRCKAMLAKVREAVESARGALAKGAGWFPVGGVGEFPISGLAFAGTRDGGAAEFLAVRDHPHPGGLWKIAVTQEGAVGTPVAWDCGDDCPRDAEAICRVAHGHFVVLSSEGAWYHVTLHGREAFTERDRGRLDSIPARQRGARNYEGFTIQSFGEAKTPVAVWGDRGRGSEPGLVVWAPVTLLWGPTGLSGGLGPVPLKIAIGPAVGSAEVSLPEPRPIDDDRRHIAELKLAKDGTLWAVSSRDPRDAGPFDSALYALGKLVLGEGKIAFDPAPTLVPHRTFSGRKVEAIELVPDWGFLFGTDDERSGGWVLRVP